MVFCPPTTSSFALPKPSSRIHTLELRTSIPPYESRSLDNRDRIRDGVRPRSGQPATDPHMWQETQVFEEVGWWPSSMANAVCPCRSEGYSAGPLSNLAKSSDSDEIRGRQALLRGVRAPE